MLTFAVDPADPLRRFLEPSGGSWNHQDLLDPAGTFKHTNKAARTRRGKHPFILRNLTLSRLLLCCHGNRMPLFSSAQTSSGGVGRRELLEVEREEGPGLRDVDQTWMLLPQDAVVPQPENPDGKKQQRSNEASKHSRLAYLSLA